MKKIAKIFWLLAIVMLIVACGEVSTDLLQHFPIEVTAVEDINTDSPLATFNGNQDLVVTIPISLTDDLLVFEITGDQVQRIVVRDAGKNVVAESDSSTFFTSRQTATADYDASSGSEARSSASVTHRCGGPCVVVKNPSALTEFYVQVTSRGETEFFAYASEYSDKGEPGNDSKAGAVILKADDVIIGAFETINDVDHYIVDEPVTVSIIPNGEGFLSGLLLVIEKSMDGGNTWKQVTDQSDGSDLSLLRGDLLRLSTADGFAGSSDSSQYQIVAQPSPTPIEVTATEQPSSLATFTGNQHVRVIAPNSLTGDLVVFEADGNSIDRVTVRGENGEAIAASSSPHFFAPASEIGTLQTHSTSFSSTAVISTKCIGPCVILDRADFTNVYYVDVHSADEVKFLAYVADYGDSGEPANNHEATPVIIQPNSTVLGAFETINDVDYYKVSHLSYVTVEALPTSDGGQALRLVVEVKSPNENSWRVIPDSVDWVRQDLQGGTLIRVSTVDGYAGTYDASGYKIVATDD